MLKIVIICLANTPQKSIEWVILGEDGKLLGNSTQGNIQDLLPSGENYEVEVYGLVPGHDVFLTTVKLPKLSQSRLLKAVPYALEVNLAENINKLHFALGKRTNEKTLPVAVVNKDKMDHWIKQLETLLHPERPFIKMLLPETLALPWQPDKWTIYIDDTLALVRTDSQAGFSIEIDVLWTVLRRLLTVPDSAPPNIIEIIGELIIPPHEIEFLNQLHIILEQKPPVNKMAFFSTDMPQSTAINLLQGPYKIGSSPSKNQKWYITWILAGACLLALTLGNLVQLVILQQQEHHIQKQITAHYKHVFPNSPLIDSQMQQRMQQELQFLRDSHADSDFLRLMHTVSPVLAHTADIKLLSLEYTDKQLTLMLSAPDFLLLDIITQALKLQNLRVELTQQTKSSNRIQARLQINEIM